MRKSYLFFMLLVSSCAIVHTKKNSINPEFLSKQLQHDEVVVVSVNHRYIFANSETMESTRYSPYGWVTPKEAKSFKICKSEECRSEINKTILIDIYYGKNHNIMTLFSGLTLTIIPSKEEEVFFAIAVVLDSEQRVLAKYKLEEQITTWYQLFLVFAMPFQDSDVKDKISKNLVNEVLLMASKDGHI